MYLCIGAWWRGSFTPIKYLHESCQARLRAIPWSLGEPRRPRSDASRAASRRGEPRRAASLNGSGHLVGDGLRLALVMSFLPKEPR